MEAILRVLSILRRFGSDQKGNFAILFGLAAIPLVGAIGIAVDYSLANGARTAMQAALDNTALSLSKQMPLTQAQLDDKGWTIFQANLGATPLEINKTDLVITPAVGKLSLSLNTKYPVRLAGVLGQQLNLDIGSRVDAVWGLGKVEVALALDNTGSMDSSGKITQLISASHNLIEILKNAEVNPGDAKIAIVPFNLQTRVDPVVNLDATWLRWDLWEETHGSCGGGGNGATKTICQTAHCSKSSRTNQAACIASPNAGTWFPAGTWTASNHNTWTGCIGDRDQNYDVDDTAVSSNATKFPALQECDDSGNLAKVMPLSENWGTPTTLDGTTLHGRINQMVAAGNTNVTIGLDWGFQMVSPTGTLPFSQGAAYGAPNLTKYVIILTDGDNTQNRFTTDQATIDARTTLACNAIKAKSIQIYSIRVINGNASLLRNCATDPSMYFEVSDSSQLAGVFNAIGSTIANLHLAK
jgi:Flp pilus assembly protein TadG